MAETGTVNRFQGAIYAALTVAVLAGGWFAFTSLNEPPPVDEQTPQIFAFEKEDLRSIKLERPDGVIELAQSEAGMWEWIGKDWRPSESMIRRVGHQTHDLTARARVAEIDDPSQYGLGDGAIRVTLGLRDGKNVTFEAGDPNPTSVSWYVRPVPGNTVFVVKKSAVDYWRLDVTEFRERRFASFEADDAVSIDAEVDGRRVTFTRSGPESWNQLAPVQQRADRQRVRTMLGRTSALKAQEFVEDAPSDLARYGLTTPKHTVKLGLEGDQTIELLVGDIVPDSQPQERYIFRKEDNTVYRARDGFLEAFLLDDVSYRDTKILNIELASISHFIVHSERYEPLRIEQTPDGFRWPDGAQIGGATPRRLASRAASPQAEVFVDAPEASAVAAVKASERFIELFVEGSAGPTVVRLGAAEAGQDALGRPEETFPLMVDGDPVLYRVNGQLDSNITSLLNEYRRKLEDDEEKGLLSAGSDTDQAE